MLKDRLKQFMIGRYGSDELSLCFLVVAGICLIFAAISQKRGAAVFFVAVLIGLVFFSIFRMLSRNLQARERENMLYKKLTGGFSRSTKGFRESMAEWWSNIRGIRFKTENKKYGPKICLFKCPGCGVDVKIPANKGKIMITCPKCGKEFERVS